MEGGKWKDERFCSKSGVIHHRGTENTEEDIIMKKPLVIPDITPACHVVALVKTDGVVSRNQE